MDLVMKELMGQCPPQDFWARIAPGTNTGYLAKNRHCKYPKVFMRTVNSRLLFCVNR